MSNYESTFICSPELPTEKLDEIVEKVKSVIETSGGNILVTQQLGRKRLAYPIKKFREGNYVYMELSGSGDMVSAIENFYKINDTVIRYLTVKAAKKKIVRPSVQPLKPEQAAEVTAVPETEIVKETAVPEPEKVKSEEVSPNE